MIDQRGTRSAKHVLRVAAEVFTVAVSGDHCALLNARLRDELVANAICKDSPRPARNARWPRTVLCARYAPSGATREKGERALSNERQTERLSQLTTA